MKILFTSHKFHPDIGGIESISFILAHYFVASGHSLRLVTQSIGDSKADLTLFPFLVLRRPSPQELLSSYSWADVVFQNNLEVRQLWVNLLTRKPLFIALHTWLRSVDGRRGITNILKQAALHSASRVVAVSESIRKDTFGNSIVIGNPYRSDLFRVLPDVVKKPAIVFLGRLVSDKGVDLLLRAYADLDKPLWPLSIIGTGPEQNLLEILAEELGIRNSVAFLGALQGEPLVRALNQHQLMVVPSRWQEPFGVVALEGIACGCIVLASDGGGLPEAVGPAGLLFKRGDQADLTAKLEFLIADGDMRSMLRSQAPGHLAKFQEDVVCNRYLNYLERLVQKPC
jgi:glycogen synthase